MLVLVFVLVSGAAVGEVELVGEEVELVGEEVEVVGEEVELVADEVGLEVDEVDPVDVVVEV